MNAILFLDDWMVERRSCLERVWGRPEFVKEVFTDYHPDVLGYGGYLSVFFDEAVGRYMMYLAVYPPEADPGTFVVRLESDDPYEWPNPSYDVSATPAWKGFEDVVVNEDGNRFWPLVTRSLAGTPLEERGCVATCIPADRTDQFSYVAWSRDGLHFRIDWDRPWHDARSDTWSGVVWNERTGAYQIHTRPVNVDRRVSLIRTTDFEMYSPLRTVLQPDALDRTGTEFYSMPARRYEDMFIGLLHLFSTDSFEENRIKMAGRQETELAYSYNGLNWYRTIRRPFIGIRDYGLQGGGQATAQELLRTEDDKLLFYVSATRGEHAAYRDMQEAGMDTRGFIGTLLYEMRLDGFCSLKTWGKDGLLRTKALVPRAGEMRLNVRTTDHTAVRVQLLDGETAEPIPGYTLEEAVPISGDQLFAEPRWKERNDISELVDRPVRIEVAMREAELFAIRLDCRPFIGRTPTSTV